MEDCEWDVKKTSERLRVTPSGAVAVTEDAVLAGQYAEMLQQSIADFAFLDRSVSKSYVQPRDPASNPGLDTKNSLVELNARLKQAHIRARACDRRWKHLIRQCEAAEVTVAYALMITDDAYSYAYNNVDAMILLTHRSSMLSFYLICSHTVHTTLRSTFCCFGMLQFIACTNPLSVVFMSEYNV